MDELISRQAAIALIEGEPYDYVTVSKMKRLIEGLPAADPVKHGQWNFVGNNKYRCTNCGELYIAPQLDKTPRYCPNCGAKMDGEEDDNHDYERAIDELEHNILYEPTFNIDDGSM